MKKEHIFPTKMVLNAVKIPLFLISFIVLISISIAGIIDNIGIRWDRYWFAFSLLEFLAILGFIIELITRGMED